MKCPHCGREIDNKLGAEVKTYGYYTKDGIYTDIEFGDTIEYYCNDCGGTLPSKVADEFFDEKE